MSGCHTPVQDAQIQQLIGHFVHGPTACIPLNRLMHRVSQMRPTPTCRIPHKFARARRGAYPEWLCSIYSGLGAWMSLWQDTDAAQMSRYPSQTGTPQSAPGTQPSCNALSTPMESHPCPNQQWQGHYVQSHPPYTVADRGNKCSKQRTHPMVRYRIAE
jgi:hypothetical protein